MKYLLLKKTNIYICKIKKVVFYSDVWTKFIFVYI